MEQQATKQEPGIKTILKDDFLQGKTQSDFDGLVEKLRKEQMAAAEAEQKAKFLKEQEREL